MDETRKAELMSAPGWTGILDVMRAWEFDGAQDDDLRVLIEEWFNVRDAWLDTLGYCARAVRLTLRGVDTVVSWDKQAKLARIAALVPRASERLDEPTIGWVDPEDRSRIRTWDGETWQLNVRLSRWERLAWHEFD